MIVARVPYCSMQNDHLKPPAQERPHQPRFLHALDGALAELQAVPMPEGARFALEALRANLRARSAYLDATTALLMSKLLRGLATIPSHVDVK
jgi:hypothetical protein